MTLVEKFIRVGDGSPILWKSVWLTSVDYAVDDTVINDGSGYICILAHTSGAASEPGTGGSYATYWEVFPGAGPAGVKGDTGDPGTMAEEGDWATSTTYQANDLVQHARSGYGKGSYICTSGHTSGASTEPEVGADWATVWSAFAYGGADGAGTGDFVGPASSTTDHIVSFGDNSGKLGKDAGTPETIVNAVLLAESASTTAPVGTTDSLVVDENGTMKRKTADSFAKKYIHVNIKAGTWLASITNGCTAASSTTQIELSTNDFNLVALAFPHTAKKYATCDFELPDGYDGGTISGYVTWYSTGTTSSGVRFGLQGVAIGNDESMDASWGTAVEVTDSATGATYKRLKSPVMADITLGGTPAGGETCELRLYRDPTHGDDVLDETIYVLGVKLKIGINKHSE
ncbi:hypothetical protein M0R72_06765 [Candidatus Pacearchaeota archaeon]|jgi:hypothetical protein|nr:hypothetical protein [Candidatus Pacearchaeota archaeon]